MTIDKEKMDVGIQTDKPKITEKQREALKKGRDEYHRMNREYKAILLAQQNTVVEEEAPPPPPPPKQYKLSFM